MGNCQAIDNATLLIQYPSGRVDKLYWPVTASEIMKMNPDHYVALLLTTTFCPPSSATTATNASGAATNNVNSNSPVRITRIKLLRPTDTLLLGHVYRLITTQEVMKGLLAKKHAKMMKKKKQVETAETKDKAEGLDFEAAEKKDEAEGLAVEAASTRSKIEDTKKVMKQHRHRSPVNCATAKSRAWQPSLHSITEAGS